MNSAPPPGRKPPPPPATKKPPPPPAAKKPPRKSIQVHSTNFLKIGRSQVEPQDIPSDFVHVLESNRFVIEKLDPGLSFMDIEDVLQVNDIEIYKFLYNDIYFHKPHKLYFVLEKGNAGIHCVATSAHKDENDGAHHVLILSKTGYKPTKTSAKAVKRSKSQTKLKDLFTLGDSNAAAGYPPLINLKLCLPLPDSEWVEVDEQHEFLSKKLQHFETRLKFRHYKFGIVYVAPGQTEEDDFYLNQEFSPAFKTFLEQMGSVISLQGHKGFKGGLDVKDNSTGEYSLYDKFYITRDGFILSGHEKKTEGCIDMQIMYHVAPFLPHTDFEVQQLQKKRHIGNDIVVIIFKDGEQPFPPETMTSQFNHVFVVVTPWKNKSGAPVEHYKVTVTSKCGVKPWTPFLPDNGIIHFSNIRAFLLPKLINAERAGMLSFEFAKKMERTIDATLRNFYKEWNEMKSKNK